MNSKYVTYRRACSSDYEGMVKLQHANFINNLSAAEALDGFLSIEYTEEQFEEINNDAGIAVAIKDGELAGYLCGASCGYSKQFPILNAVVQQFSNSAIQKRGMTETNTFVYGPVCIDRSFRGSGVLQGLYGTIKEIARPRYGHCVLFISDRNSRSLSAHLRLGMRDLGKFEFNGKSFHLLCAAIG